MDVAAAPAIWSPKLLSSYVLLEAMSSSGGNRMPTKIEEIGYVSAEYKKDGRRYFVIKGRTRRHRVCVKCHIKSSVLVAHIPLNSRYEIRTAASENLYRLIFALPSLAKRAGLSPTRYQRTRLVQLLQLLDAEEAGMRRRDMAYQILYPNHDIPGNTMWKASNERRRFYRMLEDAHFLSDNGYRHLLQGAFNDKRT